MFVLVGKLDKNRSRKEHRCCVLGCGNHEKRQRVYRSNLSEMTSDFVPVVLVLCPVNLILFEADNVVKINANNYIVHKKDVFSLVKIVSHELLN